MYVVHTFNPNTRRLKQESYCKFEANMVWVPGQEGYIQQIFFKEKLKNTKSIHLSAFGNVFFSSP